MEFLTKDNTKGEFKEFKKLLDDIFGENLLICDDIFLQKF